MAHSDLGFFIETIFQDKKVQGRGVWYIEVEGRHRLISRAIGGDRQPGSHWERCQIFYRNGPPNPNDLGTRFVVIGEDFASPTDYVKHEPKDGTYTYAVEGSYHYNGRWWTHGGSVTVTKTKYQNGYSYTIAYDVDAYVVEVADVFLPGFVLDAESTVVGSPGKPLGESEAETISKPDSLELLLESLPQPFWS